MSENTVKVSGTVSLYTKRKIDEYVKRKNLPIHLLISIAIEHELEREKPFDYDLDAPRDEYLEFAWASEARKILDYLLKNGGASLETISLMRHDIGIPDKQTFMLAWRECILSGAVETYKPKPVPYTTFRYNDDVDFYRVKNGGSKKIKEARKKANEYETFQKLKKKFKDE